MLALLPFPYFSYPQVPSNKQCIIIQHLPCNVIRGKYHQTKVAINIKTVLFYKCRRIYGLIVFWANVIYIGIEMEQSEQLEVMYEVQSILKKKINSQNKPLYLIKWKGWKQKTWEPIEHLYNVPEMIYQFQQSEKRNRKIIKEQSKISNHPHSHPHPHPPPKIHFEKSKKIKRTKLKKMSEAILDSPASENQQQEQHISKQNPVQDTQSHKVSEHPRVKITKQYMKVENEKCEPKRKGDIYSDQIERILKIENRDDKWMVLVQFYQPFQDSWEERDIIRMLVPHKLLVFYEALQRSRKKEKIA